MADYYSILGLTKTATDIEIKTAFRRLAKIYHPDKNPNDPNAKHLFQSILKAYNVLSNTHSRRRHDDNSNFSSQPKQKTQARNHRNRGQKEWETSDEELKRREYYKKHYHAKKSTVSQETPKTHYSDYKYVLFATPIAVGLLMLIISFFSAEPKANLIAKKTSINSTKENNSLQESTIINKLINGDKPYSGYFGNIKLFDTPHVLKINNSTNYDAVIAIFDKQTNIYLQHSYVQAAYSIEFSKLPATGVYWKCILGKNWNSNTVFLDNKVSGIFDSIVQFQNWKKNPIEFNQNDFDELNLLYVITPDSKSKQYISNDKEFFEK